MKERNEKQILKSMTQLRRIGSKLQSIHRDEKTHLEQMLSKGVDPDEEASARGEIRRIKLASDAALEAWENLNETFD